MALYASRAALIATSRGNWTDRGFMADAASGRKRSGITLHAVNIVAGAAAHRAALLKAAAGSEQADLVSVDVRLRMRFVLQSRVAAGAEVEARRPNDLLVPVSFAVALGALDPQLVAVRVSRTGGGSLRLQTESRSVAVEALGRDATAEMHSPVLVARTVDPTPGCHVKRDGKLKQQPTTPVEIRLTTPTGADHQIEAFRL